ELEVNHRRGGHGAHELQSVQVVSHSIEQPFAVAEERRRKMDLHLVYQSCREVLPGSLRAARESDVLAAGSAPRQLQGSLEPFRDEGEGRAAFELERLARVMREHEHRVMERRIVAPPAVPG